MSETIGGLGQYDTNERGLQFIHFFSTQLSPLAFTLPITLHVV